MGKAKSKELRAANVIAIRGARVNNLKNISLDIPRNQLVVITGVSGSGKSSLAFDTLYAEGQRRYVESLSSYARQFMGKIAKPEVDLISGIPPAIAIEQKVNTRNPRSTVGTSTEIYDYLRLLYGRIGRTYSPVSGRLVKRHSVSDVVNRIGQLPEGTKLMLLCPIDLLGQSPQERLAALAQSGFTRVEVGGSIVRIDSPAERELLDLAGATMRLVVDRFSACGSDDSNLSRMADSIQTAFHEGRGTIFLKIYVANGEQEEEYSNLLEVDGIKFEELSEHLFNFNNPMGACPQCDGYGNTVGIAEELVVPNKSLSIYEDAIACWRGETMSWYKRQVIDNATRYKLPIHTPYSQLTAEQRGLLWNGTKHFAGINGFFDDIAKQAYKIQYRVLQSRYRGKTTCPSCGGSRLRPEASYVRVGNKAITELVDMPIWALQQFFAGLQLNEHDGQVAKRILTEINNRIEFLVKVGLGYLTLNRPSSTLSGGESQRINLATSLGSNLVGSLYILDEPSIGLHPRDTHQLIDVMLALRDLGNTVVVVEHDEEIMRAADHLIDIGPQAGRLGGEVVFQGTASELAKAQSLTASYLNGTEQIPTPSHSRQWNNYIEVRGARANNLKNITVRIPLNTLTVVTGVSGSGKSSLVRGILYPAVQRALLGTGEPSGEHDELHISTKVLRAVEMVDQSPIGRSSRSNPVSYVKAWDDIRKLLCEQPLARRNDLSPSAFSFNVEGGRCEECHGDGVIRVGMQFMADITLVCESCHGRRFKSEILDVHYRGANVYDILEMTVNQALEFFETDPSSTPQRIAERLRPLRDVGLGYIKLGQSSSTLSGGESQRVKLAAFLQKDSSAQPTLFIFDEPTTGLHFHDIRRLLESINALVDKGHSALLIEHNLEVIKSADWLIDMGPEGGDGGGQVVFEGTPQTLAQRRCSHTAKFLAGKLG
ncbi:MAG: excinuclease ABC subunit UvrA [Bacteroidales bacterium]|nr:excinuclease ABC subunit UvrA [Bacteroidales bacterium]